VNNVFERIRKEGLYSDLKYCHSICLEGLKRNEMPQSGFVASEATFEGRTSRMRSKKCKLFDLDFR
jgi:hypothetical protein